MLLSRETTIISSSILFYNRVKVKFCTMTFSGFKNIFVAIIYKFWENVCEKAVDLILVASMYNN